MCQAVWIDHVISAFSLIAVSFHFAKVRLYDDHVWRTCHVI